MRFNQFELLPFADAMFLKPRYNQNPVMRSLLKCRGKCFLKFFSAVKKTWLEVLCMCSFIFLMFICDMLVELNSYYRCLEVKLLLFLISELLYNTDTTLLCLLQTHWNDSWSRKANILLQLSCGCKGKKIKPKLYYYGLSTYSNFVIKSKLECIKQQCIFPKLISEGKVSF